MTFQHIFCDLHIGHPCSKPTNSFQQLVRLLCAAPFMRWKYFFIVHVHNQTSVVLYRNLKAKKVTVLDKAT